MYLPFAYASAVKHPRQRFVWRSVVQEDGMFWLLATVFLVPAPLWHVVATGLFLVSFWCIYELGYIENDYAAVNFEGDAGHVPDRYDGQQPPTPWAWAWAILLGAAGAAALAASEGFAGGWGAWLTQCLIWLAVLVACRLVFAIYNRLVPSRRSLLYAVLQGFRNFSVLAFAATNLTGVMVLLAHTVARTVPYFLYRLAGDAYGQRRKAWPTIPVFLLRLALFVMFVVVSVIGLRDPAILFQLQTWAILAWCVFRSRKELLDALRGLEWLAR